MSCLEGKDVLLVVAVGCGGIFLIVKMQRILVGRMFSPLLTSLIVLKKMDKHHVFVCEQSN